MQSERQLDRRSLRLAPKCHRSNEGPDRVCDLLLHCECRQEDPEQEVSNVQAHVPLKLFAEVVQDE